MFADDDPPRTPPQPASRSLDGLGVAELAAYVEALRTEIARAEAEITRKRAMSDAAASVFRPRT